MVERVAPNGRVVTNNYIFVKVLFCNAYKFSQSYNMDK